MAHWSDAHHMQQCCLGSCHNMRLRSELFYISDFVPRRKRGLICESCAKTCAREYPDTVGARRLARRAKAAAAIDALELSDESATVLGDAVFTSGPLSGEDGNGLSG